MFVLEFFGIQRLLCSQNAGVKYSIVKLSGIQHTIVYVQYT